MIKNNLKYFPRELIICPNCKSNKIFLKRKIIFCSNCKESYPIINDIPILITRKNCMRLNLNYYKKNLEYEILNSKNFKFNKFGILKYVENILMGTSGILYENIKNLKKYPIANVPFNKKKDNKKLNFLDIGCGWGRWTINAAQKNYKCIGIDISIQSLTAAKKICDELKLKNCFFICCDVKNLPLKNNSFNYVFSFSFLQHFSENNLRIILKNILSKIKYKGIFKTQMVNKFSLRGLYNNFKIKYFSESMIKTGKMDKRLHEDNFTVRYFSISKINKIFKQYFSIKKIENYSFFTQAQYSDFDIFSKKFKLFLIISNFFNWISKYIFFLKYISDNILLTVTKKKSNE